MPKKQLNARVITPIFKDRKNGQYKVFSFFAKKARGLMARFIIQNQITDPEDIRVVDVAGYRSPIPMVILVCQNNENKRSVSPLRKRLGHSILSVSPLNSMAVKGPPWKRLSTASSPLSEASISSA